MKRRFTASECRSTAAHAPWVLASAGLLASVSTAAARADAQTARTTHHHVVHHHPVHHHVAPVVVVEQPPPDPEPAPAVVEVAPEPPPPPPPPPPATPRYPAFDLLVGYEALGRHLNFGGDATGFFRAYDVDGAPALTASTDFYPGAFFTRGPLAHIGLTGSVDYVLGLSSTDSSGQSYSGTAYGYSVGLRVRIPVEQAELTASVVYGSQYFNVGYQPTDNDPGIPTALYHSVRAGVTIRQPFADRFAILAHIGYLGVLSSGDIANLYFPHASVFGLEGGLGLSVALVRMLELRANVDIRSYFYSLNAQPSDTYVANSATDLFYTVTLGLALRL